MRRLIKVFLTGCLVFAGFCGVQADSFFEKGKRSPDLFSADNEARTTHRALLELTEAQREVFEHLRADKPHLNVWMLGDALQSIKQPAHRAVIIRELEKFAISHIPGTDAPKSLDVVQQVRQILQQHDVDPAAPVGRWDFQAKMRAPVRLAAEAYTKAGLLYEASKWRALTASEYQSLDALEAVLHAADRARMLILRQAALAVWSPGSAPKGSELGHLNDELIAVLKACSELSEALQGDRIPEVIEKADVLGDKLQAAYEKGSNILSNALDDAMMKTRRIAAGMNAEIFSQILDLNGDGTADTTVRGYAVRNIGSAGEFRYDPFLVETLPKLTHYVGGPVSYNGFQQYKRNTDQAWGPKNTHPLTPEGNPYIQREPIGSRHVAAPSSAGCTERLRGFYKLVEAKIDQAKNDTHRFFYTQGSAPSEVPVPNEGKREAILSALKEIRDMYEILGSSVQRTEMNDEFAGELLRNIKVVDGILASAERLSLAELQQRLESFSTAQQALWNGAQLLPAGQTGVDPRRYLSGTGRPDISGELPVQSKAAVESDYETFMREAYRNASTDFASMTAHRGGFGGVIFGNEVNGPDRPIKFIRWVQYFGNPYFGTLELVDSRNTVFRMQDVPLEDAYAAHEIVFKGSGGWREGQGLGLVGIYNRQVCVLIEEHTFKDLGGWFRVIMHPALLHTDLGWSVLMVDAAPIADEALERMVRQTVGVDAAKAVSAFYNRTKAGTWKITDVPVEIALTNETVMVRGLGPAGAGSYLTIVPFGKSGETDAVWREQFIRGFAGILPHLIKGSADFERVDRFARTLAVFRYAKQRGARYQPNYHLPEPSHEGLHTPPGIKAFDSTVLPSKPSPGEAEAKKILQDNLYVALSRLKKDRLPGDHEQFRKKAREMAGGVARFGEIEKEKLDINQEISRLDAADRNAVVGVLKKAIDDEISNEAAYSQIKDLLKSTPDSRKAGLLKLMEQDMLREQYKQYVSGMRKEDADEVARWLNVINLLQEQGN